MQVHQILYGSESLPLRIGNIEIPCYIIENVGAVFTRDGFQQALGYDGKSSAWLYDFLGSINKFYPIPGILFEAYEQPIAFEIRRADGTSAVMEGIIPETLEMTCITIINAKKDGYLSVGQLKHAKAAEKIINYALDNNLHRDVEVATGFVFLKETGKKHLQQMLIDNNGEMLYQWTKTLPDAFFEKMLDLHGLHWTDLRKKPAEVAKILHETVFSRLPETLVETLRTEMPKRAYKSKNRLSDNEHPELKIYIAEVLSLLKAAADNWPIFMQLLNRIHPTNSIPEPVMMAQQKIPENLSILDSNLAKGVSVNRLYKKRR